MKPVECPWKVISKGFLVPVLVFVVLFIGALFFDFVLGMDVPHGSVYYNFAIQGGAWLLLSGGFFIYKP
jgi:hypothetical protein